METIAQTLRLTAASLEDHGRNLKDQRVKRAALRMQAGGSDAYNEEGQNLLRSAARDLRDAPERYDRLSLYVQRAADYLEVENDHLARYFATAARDEVKILRLTEPER